MRLRAALLSLAVVGVWLSTSPWWAVAQQSANNDSNHDARKPSTARGESSAANNNALVTPEREAAAMTFVKQHQPQLERLLVYLKRKRPREYNKAIRELFRTSERLTAIQERDLPRYELELRAWQIQSQIEILAARLQMEQTDELKNELRAALQEQVDIKLAILQTERQRLADRLGKLDHQLDRLRTNRQQDVERQLQQLTSGNDPRAGKPAAKNAKPGEAATRNKDTEKKMSDPKTNDKSGSDPSRPAANRTQPTGGDT